jgi:N-methylhydantoinase A
MVAAANVPRFAGQGKPVPRATRKVFLRDAWQDAAIYTRDSLGAGDAFDGPAVIEQDDTTVLVLPGWQVRTDALGNLHLTPVQGRGPAQPQPSEQGGAA